MKTFKNFTLLFIFFSFIALSLSSCQSDEDTSKIVNVHFKHLINHHEVQFDTIQYTNLFGNLHSVSTIKYFISDIVLHKTDGDITISEAHYIDGKLNNTLKITKDFTIKDDESVTGISFVYGLTEARNTVGAFPNSPESAMEWPIPMGGGYHYMKFEGKHDSSGTIKNFQCHTGPTNGNLYYRSFNFDIDNSANTLDIDVEMNMEKWFSTPNTLDLNQVTMIMGNENMQTLLKENSQDVFTINVN